MTLPFQQPGASKFGAQLGRRDGSRPPPGSRFTVITVHRVKLDDGGYDEGGAYWGIGAPLWYVESDDGTLSEFKRAACRAELLAELRAKRGLSWETMQCGA
jgi:hypothetical protein